VKLSLNKAHFPVSVLGFGQRIGIWTQGCKIHCQSCCSLDTWNFAPHQSINIESLMDWCRDVSKGELDGLTISGGEPFDQPDGLLAFLMAFDVWRKTLSRNIDILVYSGYSGRNIKLNFEEHLRYIDAVVAGPYKEKYDKFKPYAGSDNQEIFLCTALAETRYGLEQLKDWKTGIQMTVDQQGIWMIGIPQSGDLKLLENRCLEHNLVFKDASWRS
jgi:anaerobic ribonucleoside-triphosphate reductase activating protein